MNWIILKFNSSLSPMVCRIQYRRILWILFLAIIYSQSLFSQIWSNIGTGGANDWVYATTVYNGNLIVGGKFTSIGGVSANHIAKWNGTSWQPLGAGLNGKVNALMVYNGNLYAGGEFTMSGSTTVNYIAKWNGTQWKDDLGDMNNIVTSLAVYNNMLYVGGYFTSADGTPANYIAKTNGDNWFTVGAGVGGTQGQIMALGVYNNQLIAGGFFTTAGGSPASHIASWNGSTWSPVGTGISGIVYALTTYNGNLIAGGLFTAAGGNSANHIASWNGSTWSPLGIGMSGTYYQYVLTLGTYNNNLIAGGYFTHAGGVLTNGIASWNGSTWSSLSTGLTYPANVYGAHAQCLYENNLVVGGLFTNAGGTSAAYLAMWNAPLYPLNASVSGSNATCANSFDGTVNLTVSGGTPPYTYYWSDGSITEDLLGVEADTYSVTVTDSAGISVSASYTVGVSYPVAIPTITASGPTSFCTGDSVTLSTGVYSSYLWSTGDTTSSITVNTTDSYSVQVMNAYGCAEVSQPVSVFSNPCQTILQLKLFIEGYYNGSSTMVPVLFNEGINGSLLTDVDDILVELHSSVAPYGLVDSQTVRLHSDGTAICNFQPLSGSYYIGIRHRNAIYTWSSQPVLFNAVAVSYDFTDSASHAFGNNMIQVELGVWALFTGDVFSDENIDLLDISQVEGDVSSFQYGYLSTDLNGDGNVDLLDIPIIENNIGNFIYSAHP